MNRNTSRSLSIVALVAIAGLLIAQPLRWAPRSPRPAKRRRPSTQGFRSFRPETHRVPESRESASAGPSLVFWRCCSSRRGNVYQTAKLKQNPAPIATIHAAHGCPYNLAMNKHGTLFVADNCGGNDVEEYAKGKTTMKTSITTGISNPLGVAIDAAGTLYVSNYPASITVYPAGSTSPSKTITGGGMMNRLGVSPRHDRDAARRHSAANGASRCASAGQRALARSAARRRSGRRRGGLRLLLVTAEPARRSGTGRREQNPVKTLPGNGSPYAISLQNRGRPRLEVVESDVSTDAVYAYKLHDTVPYATLTNGIQLPTGLLIAKP